MTDNDKVYYTKNYSYNEKGNLSMDDSMKTMRKQQEIYNLLAELQSNVSEIGDWKIIKHQEYLLAGLESPYDITELNIQRQAVRDRISELREEMKK